MEETSTFVSPEGVYTQNEEHKPTLNAPIYNTQNAPTAAAVSTKISAVMVNFPALKHTSQSFTSLLSVGNKSDKKEKDKKLVQTPVLPSVQDRDESVSSGEADGATPADGTDVSPTANNASATPAEPPNHPILFSPTIGSGVPVKRKGTRSKQNLKTTTSSFVTRYHSIEGLSKHLASKVGDTTFMFYNSGKTFYMTEVETGQKYKDPLIRISFNAWPTCHAVNQSTASSSGLDVIIGFHTGDLMWFDPLTTRYLRLNKQGCITNSPCTAIRWVPGSRNLFLVSHQNGTIIVYDKEREDDPNFQPSLPPDGPDSKKSPPFAPTEPDDVAHKLQRHLHLNQVAPHPAHLTAAQAAMTSWNSLEDMWVTRPGFWDDSVGMEKEREKELALAATRNPVSHWRISRKCIIDFAFSPDVRYIAVVSEDGKLRIIDALSESLVDTYAAYFGILTCVTWSPDGRFIAAGGQDDLVTIFSPTEQRVIARCQGHFSFVAGVAFDALRCDGRTYRFASVGEDCKLVLWDFSSGALHRPRLQAMHHRSSISSQYSLVLRSASGTLGRASLDTGPGDGYSAPFGYGFGGAPRASASKYHPAPSRNEVATVQPVVIKSVEGDILSNVAVVANSILTCSRNGTIKVWARPPPPTRGTRRAKAGKRKEPDMAVSDINGPPSAGSMEVGVAS